MGELEPDSINHIITDPPYEQILHDAVRRGLNRNDGKKEQTPFGFAGIDLIRDRFVELAHKPTKGWLLCFCTTEGTARWADAINPSKIKYKRACIWIKPDSTPQMNGQCPAAGSECFVCAWCGRGKSSWNSGGKRGVYGYATRNTDRHGDHPTEKPVALMMEILGDFANKGDIILDPFMGSGTTLVACERLGIRGIGIELDWRWFNTACKRVKYADITGKRLKESETRPDLFIDNSA